MANLTPTNKKVTELPVATTIAPTDVLLVVQGGVTKQVTHDTILTAIASSTALAAKYSTLALQADGITYDSNGNVATEARLGKTKTWSYNGSGNPTESVIA